MRRRDAGSPECVLPLKPCVYRASEPGPPAAESGLGCTRALRWTFDRAARSLHPHYV